jgi:DNA-directed RNA polymerase subunit omega
MARTTIEDCIKLVKNRFELVVLAAQRGKELNQGESSMMEKQKDIVKKDKDAIIALREIAAGKLDINALKGSVIKRFFIEDNDVDMFATKEKVIDEIHSLKESPKNKEGALYQDEKLIGD